jgi:F-type H+-transporting ATPase subunit alpha
MVELLKQPQYKPLGAIDQVMSIYAGTQGHVDDVARTDVSRWETAFLTFIRERKADLRNSLEKEKKLTPKLEADLQAAIAEFKEKHFR